VPNLKQPWSPTVKLLLENGRKQEKGKDAGAAAAENRSCCDNSKDSSQMSRTQLSNVLAQQLLVEHQELGVSALKVASDGTVELQLEEERASSGSKPPTLQTSPSTRLAAPAEAAAYKLAKQVRLPGACWHVVHVLGNRYALLGREAGRHLPSPCIYDVFNS
jgi:hypothetical protein